MSAIPPSSPPEGARPAPPPPARLMHGQLAELCRQAVYRLAMLVKTAQIHHVANDALRYSIRSFAEACNELHAAFGEVLLRGDADVVFVGEVRVRPEPLMFENIRRLLAEFRQRGIGGLRIRRRLTSMDVRQLLQVLLRDRPRPGEEGAARLTASLARAGLEGIEALPPMALVAGDAASALGDRDVRSSVVETYAALFVHLRAFHQFPGRVPELIVDRTQAHLRRLVDHALEHPDLVLAAATWRHPPDYVWLHSVHMAVLSVLIGAALDLPRRSLLDLAGAALYADAGMKRLPPGLVVPEDRLSPEEQELLRSHPLESVKEILRQFSLAGTGRERIVAAFEHHVTLPGEGYPRRSDDRPLHLFSRVIAVADAYDAFTSDRPGGGVSLTPPEAIERLVERRERFDPAALEALLNLLGPYPIGSCVLLSDQRIGVVCVGPAPGRDPERPRLRVVPPGGSGAGEELDLAGPAGRGLQILAPVQPQVYGVQPWKVLLAGWELPAAIQGR